MQDIVASEPRQVHKRKTPSLIRGILRQVRHANSCRNSLPRPHEFVRAQPLRQPCYILWCQQKCQQHTRHFFFRRKLSLPQASLDAASVFISCVNNVHCSLKTPGSRNIARVKGFAILESKRDRIHKPGPCLSLNDHPDVPAASQRHQADRSKKRSDEALLFLPGAAWTRVPGTFSYLALT